MVVNKSQLMDVAGCQFGNRIGRDQVNTCKFFCELQKLMVGELFFIIPAIRSAVCTLSASARKSA